MRRPLLENCINIARHVDKVKAYGLPARGYTAHPSMTPQKVEIRSDKSLVTNLKKGLATVIMKE